MRTFWPIWREVEELVGFRRAIVATGTPVCLEMTAKVSPAWTVQNRFAGLCAVVVVPGGEETGTVPDRFGFDPPAFMPARIRRIAIVTASKKAAGAT
jgi:hypothetical protein